MSDVGQTSSTRKMNLSLDYRFIIVLLLATIGTMLLIWKPWSPAAQDDSRVIEVTGEATLKAEPDEYVFSPSYQVSSGDKQKAIDAVTKKSDIIIDKLKSLGVADSKIKSNASGYDYYNYYYYDQTNKTNTYTLQLTVTLDNRELAQKVQDYLVTTKPTGQVTPSVNFSDAKRKELEGQARDQATKEARAKADQSAKNLGFKIGKVKAVKDGTGFGQVYPHYGRSDLGVETSAVQDRKLSVQPGENELSYSVIVTYYLR